MDKTGKLKPIKRFDPKSPCPHCGEKIGFVESHCPLCGEEIPYWGDTAGKIVIGLGVLLASSYVLGLYFSWGENDALTELLLQMGRAFCGLAIILAHGNKSWR